MAFRKGSKAIYPHHGAVVVADKETISVGGTSEAYLTLRTLHLKTPMTLSLPVANVEQVGVREPISRADAEDLFDLLRKQDVREPSAWSRRYKNHQEKMKSGDVYQLAEVVRNLWRRQHDKGLSPGETDQLSEAMRLLSSEMSLTFNIDLEAAEDKLEDVLAEG